LRAFGRERHANCRGDRWQPIYSSHLIQLQNN
jgi:hypothetical protein